MIRALLLLVLLAPTQDATVRFTYVDLVVDSAGPLAAWQVELTAEHAKIVGVEGGDAAAYAAAPYYDPVALQQGRIIVAAFTTDAKAPAGRVRVARIHFEVRGNPDYSARLVAAAAPGGERLADARLTLVRAGGGK